MKNVFLLFPVCIILLSSCNPKKRALQKMMVGCDTVQIHTRAIPDHEGHHSTYIAEDFANKACDAFSVKSVKKNHSELLSLHKEPFQNIHDTTRIDTIYHFSGEKDSIKFYRSREKDLMVFVSLASPEFALHQCVRPGMHKETFLNIFAIAPPVGDTIKIVNSDQTLIFIFYFRDNKLHRIRSDIYFG